MLRRVLLCNIFRNGECKCHKIKPLDVGGSSDVCVAEMMTFISDTPFKNNATNTSLFQI